MLQMTMPPPRGGVSHRTVVVVDDDIDLCSSIEVALVSRGYRVVTVPNGLELLAVLAGKKPDLILLDVMMPAVNGLDLCRALKRSPEFRDIPVVLMSALESGNDVQFALTNGAAEYLQKPFQLTQLMASVDELVGFP
jgi:two-component system, OmpR family, phosphate regulon response regulator PhoB